MPSGHLCHFLLCCPFGLILISSPLAINKPELFQVSFALWVILLKRLDLSLIVYFNLHLDSRAYFLSSRPHTKHIKHVEEPDPAREKNSLLDRKNTSFYELPVVIYGCLVTEAIWTGMANQSGESWGSLSGLLLLSDRERRCGKPI